MRSFLFPFLLASLATASAQTNTTLNLPPDPGAPMETPASSSPAAPTTSSSATNAAASGAPAPAATHSDAEAQTLKECAQMVHDGDQNGALTKLNALILSNPRSVNAYVLRGQVYSNKKLTDMAANDFQSAHLLDPTNPVVAFDVAEMKFTQKSYDAARIGFADLAKDQSTLIGDLAAFKVFLCDLVGNHPDMAAKEFDAFNKQGSGASYYYANASWSIVHHQYEDARGWLFSAGRIYTPQKNSLYMRSLLDLGWVPMPGAK